MRSLGVAILLRRISRACTPECDLRVIITALRHAGVPARRSVVLSAIVDGVTARRRACTPECDLRVIITALWHAGVRRRRRVGRHRLRPSSAVAALSEREKNSRLV